MTVPRKSALERQFAAAVKLAERFPGIEVETSYHTPGIKVNGKFMARLRTEAEGWLAIRCDFVDREILLQAAPHVFHLTPHYQNYPMILVDLAAIDKGALLEVAELRAQLALELSEPRIGLALTEEDPNQDRCQDGSR